MFNRKWIILFATLLFPRSRYTGDPRTIDPMTTTHLFTRNHFVSGGWAAALVVEVRPPPPPPPPPPSPQIIDAPEVQLKKTQADVDFKQNCKLQTMIETMDQFQNKLDSSDHKY